MINSCFCEIYEIKIDCGVKDNTEVADGRRGSDQDTINELIRKTR